MDKEVIKVLHEFLKKELNVITSDEKLEKLRQMLWDADCIIYHSTLPKINESPVFHIDATPDDSYALRILRAYRSNCNCIWSDTTNGTETEVPLLKLMNDQQKQRMTILSKSIRILEDNL